MALRADIIKSILNIWDVTKYNGSQNVGLWLMEIEEKHQIYSIPEIQMTEMAVKSTDGEVNTVLTAMFEAMMAVAGVWPWADFKECVIRIEDHYRQNTRDGPPGTEDGDFRSEHPYAAAALCVILVGTGALLVCPAAVAAILGAVGFGLGGVGAGSPAALLQSLMYGGTTGGVFSVLQRLGATTVASPFTTLTGATLAAVGAWFCGVY